MKKQNVSGLERPCNLPDHDFFQKNRSSDRIGHEFDDISGKFSTKQGEGVRSIKNRMIFQWKQGQGGQDGNTNARIEC
jgi:hypothetical protein